MKAHAHSPADICRLFQQYVREGDLDAVLSVYEADAVFLNRDRTLRRGLHELKEELAPFVAEKAATVAALAATSLRNERLHRDISGASACVYEAL
jgi:ketosteroid isomerase-like protein